MNNQTSVDSKWSWRMWLSFTSDRGMLLGRRNMFRFCLSVLGFGGRRNSRTWPLTRFVFFLKLLIKFLTRPKGERWGTFTTTWVSVISSGSRMLIPSSVMCATDSRPSGSGAVKTDFYFTKNNLIKLVLSLFYFQDTQWRTEQMRR